MRLRTCLSMSRTCRRPPVRPPRLSWSQRVPLHCVRSRRRVKDAVLDVSKRSKMRSRLCAWEDFTEALSSGTGNQCVVVLCGSQYAGNLGSAIRACALLGVKWLCVLDVLEWRFVQSAFRAAQLERPEHAEWNVHLVQAPAGRPQKEALASARLLWFRADGSHRCANCLATLECKARP